MVASVPAAQRAGLEAALRSDAQALGLALSDAQIDAQFALLNHLLHWNALINISAVTEPADIVDSLAALPPVLAKLGDTPSPKILDVGTGPGLPALPWALVLASQIPTAQLRAVDAVRKKIDTITDFIQKQSLTNVTAEHARIESLKSPFDVVTSRAFSSLRNFVTLAGPCVKKGASWRR
jgi:16S rRNA (guanine527-N7)-methyltransferase